MAETKFTPTPWEVESDNHKEIGQVELGRFRLKSGKRPIIDGYILNEEDAAHIVKCVNMHDELVRVIRGLLDAYSRPDVTLCCNGNNCGCRGYSSRDRAEYFADETLKKAGAI